MARLTPRQERVYPEDDYGHDSRQGRLGSLPDVLKNIATADLEQKKLVYLYLMWVNPGHLKGEPHMLTTGIV